MKASNATRLGIAAAAAASMLVLAGCSSAPGDSGDDDTLSVAWFSYALANTYLAANLEGLESVAGDYDAEITSFDANGDSATQVRQMRDAMATGQYDAFIVSPVDAAALVPVAEDAVELGITVASVSFAISDDPTALESSVPGVITVGYSVADNGAAIGEGVVAACEGIDPCKTAYMIGSPGQPSDVARVEGAKSVIAEHSNIELVATPVGGWDQTSGLKAAQDLLAANPDLNVIASSAGQAIGGAMKALEDAGLEGTVKLVSNGATTQDVDAIRAGQMTASAVLLPFDEGAYVLQYVAEAVDGGTPPTATSIYDLSPIGPIASAETLGSDAGADFTGQYSA